VAEDLAAQRLSADIEAESSFRVDERPLVVALEVRGQILEEFRMEGIDLELVDAVDFLGGEFIEEVLRVFVGVNSHRFGDFGGFVKLLGAWASDFDPQEKTAARVGDAQAGFFGIAQAAGVKLKSVLKIQSVGEDARDQVDWNFRRMHGDPEIKSLINAAVDVGEIDAKTKQRRRQRHGSGPARFEHVRPFVDAAVVADQTFQEGPRGPGSVNFHHQMGVPGFEGRGKVRFDLGGARWAS